MTISRSLKDQLLAHKRLTPSGCWEWTGWINREGYGRIQYKGKKYLTHRISALVFKGYDLTDYANAGLQVNHLCHNRKCFNPSHFYIGTQDENMNDLVDKNAGITLLTPPAPTKPEDCVDAEEVTTVPSPDELAALELLRSRGYAVVAIHPDEIVEGIDPEDLEDWMYEASDEFQDLHVNGEDEEEDDETAEVELGLD